MFKPRHRYRHRNTLDIDIDVLGVLGEDEESVSLIVGYWNRRSKFYQGKGETVRVKKADYENWSEVENEYAYDI